MGQIVYDIRRKLGKLYSAVIVICKMCIHCQHYIIIVHCGITKLRC